MNDEQVVFICRTGVGFGGDFFAQQEKVTIEDLMPAIHELMRGIDGTITKPGMYAFELKVTKLK